MRVIRVIFGFFLLLGMAAESANVIRQFGTLFYAPIFIMVIPLLFLITWLIGGGFTKEKLNLKSFRFWIFFIVTSVLFVLITVIKLSSHKVPSDIAEVNGIKIPIGHCLQGSIYMVPDANERKRYCTCLAEKLSGSQSVVDTYRKELERGDMAKVLKALESDQLYATLELQSCLGSTNMQWTDNVINGMKKNCRAQLQNTDFEATNDIEKYCDCLAYEYIKFPASEVAKQSFRESAVGLGIDSACIQASKRVK
jgi:hypothetical protein